jgi:hypothetical protein
MVVRLRSVALPAGSLTTLVGSDQAFPLAPITSGQLLSNVPVQFILDLATSILQPSFNLEARLQLLLG